MELRIEQEEQEFKLLSQFAAKSRLSKGRERFEDKCDIRTDFQRDRDRILHCKAFRRLKHKTQVFISPEGDHYRTRLTHTLEVSQIARTIARALHLNEDLTEAIALGHDLGHTPFGHAGESALDRLCSTGFEHCSQSLRVVERLEKDGKGLNLTWEVRDGILNHRTKGKPSTLEGKVVQLSDKIAYINHDIDDAIRAGVLEKNAIPKDIVEVIGATSSERINTMIRDTLKNSIGINDVKMSGHMKKSMGDLRSFMFTHVYTDERATHEGKKVDSMLNDLFKYYMENPYETEREFVELIKEGENVETVVCDYIAGMTDRYAISIYSRLFIPTSWNIY
ncbi:MAG: deoxyguanosinetriphosphate triphosphohydrolase [Lachnospiraceae bacterium]|nr:deoxyguanosinetriphosphate triphosphohydrolase [Lachnospiraceae bacterium]